MRVTVYYSTDIAQFIGKNIAIKYMLRFTCFAAAVSVYLVHCIILIIIDLRILLGFCEKRPGNNIV